MNYLQLKTLRLFAIYNTTRTLYKMTCRYYIQ